MYWFRAKQSEYDFSETVKVATGVTDLISVLSEAMFSMPEKQVDFLHLGTYLFTLKNVTVDYSEQMLTVKHYWKVISKDGVDLNTCTREQYRRLFKPLFIKLSNAN